MRWGPSSHLSEPIEGRWNYRETEGWRLRDATLASPDGGPSAALTAPVEDGVARLKVPRLSVYALKCRRIFSGGRDAVC